MKKPIQRAPTYDDLLAIAKLIESGSRFSEFRLRCGDIEVEVKRANGGAPPAPPAQPQAQPQAQSASVTVPLASSGSIDLPPGTEVIRAPMVGTFYRAPGPGEKPFVDEGSAVKPDTIVCIIEVMKLMNSVTAGMKGVVTHVFVHDAQAVEFGQALIGIRRQDRGQTPK